MPKFVAFYFFCGETEDCDFHGKKTFESSGLCHLACVGEPNSDRIQRERVTSCMLLLASRIQLEGVTSGGDVKGMYHMTVDKCDYDSFDDIRNEVKGAETCELFVTTALRLF